MALVTCAASLAALSASGTSGAFTPINACKLIPKAQAVQIVGHPLVFLRGESIASCNLIWPGPEKVGHEHTIVDINNDAQSTNYRNSFQGQQKALRGVSVGGLGNPAFYWKSPVTANRISVGLVVHHHGSMLHITSAGTPSSVLGLSRLKALAKVALRHF
jgi:hypothetical protein